ncbi:MAG: hypothetical protein IT442_08115 [Phycisphaeraceae bacterium]|nr:hypothetical protein [Phycisphaeraceae bacterium]
MIDHRRNSACTPRQSRGLKLGRRSDRRGSVMILVVAMLVLMVLAGTAYMQRARLDRMSTDQAANKGTSDQVAAATIEQIKNVLRDDLIYDPVGGTPQFLNPATPAFDEPYDYPWTNAAISFPVATQYQQTWSGGANALGGQLDDMWLASSYPTDLNPSIVGNNVYGWEHITNLNGIFLDLPRPTAKDGSKLPIEWVTSLPNPGMSPFNGANNTDSFLPLFANAAGTLPAQTVLALTTATDPTDPATINRPGTVNGAPYANKADYQPRGYDVDGDGVPDSRWTWAPIRQANGIDYVMAVRIIDNSSMINVNSASPQTNDGTNHFLAPPIAGWPTSADLSRFLRRAGRTGNVRWSDSLSALLSRRWPSEPGTSVNPMAVGGILFSGTTAQLIRLSLSGPSGPGLGEAAWYWGAPFDSAAPGNPWWPGLINYGQYGRDPAWFGPADEIALRLGNGVRSARFGKTSLETYIDDYGSTTGLGLAHLPGNTRWEQEEDNFLQALGAPYNPTTDYDRPHVREFFEGVGSDAVLPATALSGRTYPDIRKWLTTWSGANELTGIWDPPGANEARLSAFPLPPQDFTAAGGAVTPTQRTNIRYQLDAGTGTNNLADPYDHIEDLRDRLLRILTIGHGNTPRASYQEMDTDELDATAAWMTSAIHNANSGGSQPLGIAVGTTTYYALERLPFIREVYLQGRYNLHLLSSLDPNTDPDHDEFADDPANPAHHIWRYQPNSQAFAIELANPFDQDIVTTELLAGGTDLKLVIGQGSSPTHVYSWTLTGADLPAILRPGESVVLYMRASSTGSNVNDDIPGLNLLVGLPAGSSARELTATAPLISFDQAKDIWVELLVNNVPYDRFSNNGLHIQAGTPTSVSPTEGHRQVAFARPGEFGGFEGPYYVSNLGLAQVKAVGPDGGYSTTNFHFGDPNKGFTPDPKLAALQGLRLSIPNRPMVNPAEMTSLPILGFSTGAISSTIYPTSNTYTFPDWLDYYVDTVFTADPNDPRGGAYDPVVLGTGVEQIVKRLFLDFSPTATVPLETGVSHAALVLETISTISPQFDGIDNDNDDGDDDLRTNADGDGLYTSGTGSPELFVPGKININTAPMHVIAMAAPLPEPLDELQAMAQTIVMYRNASQGDPLPVRRSNWTIYSTGVPANFGKINGTNVRGIVSLGELLTLQPDAAAGTYASPYLPAGTLAEHLNMNRWNSLVGAIPLRTAAAPTPEEVSIVSGVTPVITQVEGSAQKRAARFRYLNQLFTTRSDVYTAYIEIRGYPSDDYRKGPVERTRMIVVFDRSGVVGPTTWDPTASPLTGPRPDNQVRIVAMYRY